MLRIPGETFFCRKEHYSLTITKFALNKYLLAPRNTVLLMCRISMGRRKIPDQISETDCDLIIGERRWLRLIVLHFLQKIKNVLLAAHISCRKIIVCSQNCTYVVVYFCSRASVCQPTNHGHDGVLLW